MHAELSRIADLFERGRLDEAADEASRLRVQQPQACEPARLHGVALLALGRIDDAIAALSDARRIDPRSIETLCNLGSAWLAADDAKAACEALDAAIAIAPGHPAALNGLGNARHALGDPEGAHAAYAAAVRAAPSYLGAWINLAGVEFALGRLAEAERLARSVATQTGHPEARLLLGRSLAALGRRDEARSVFAEAERAVPGDARFPYQLGVLADEDKDHAGAAAAHARAHALAPDMGEALAQLVFVKRQLCDGRDLETLSTRLRRAVAAEVTGVSPFGFLAEPADGSEQLRCARTAAAAIRVTRSAFTHTPRETDGPVRLGFVSNGFSNHPTGLLTVALFEHLRALGADVQLFATAAGDGRVIERRLRAAATGWHVLHGLSPRTMAERIHAAAVDVLFDLRGWGGGHVAEVFAQRPAPVQVNWLAYPGTSGAPWIDYVVADRTVLPPEARDTFSEAVAYLPRCFQPSDPTRAIAEPPPREACGLPAEATVFTCFNNSYKLDPRSVERMLRVLLLVPGSVLWLLQGPAGSEANLREAARARGVDPGRLVFMPKLAHDDYLARFRHADLFLDTATYNAHTTASDALWAGCPVLTTPGATFASRVAASLLHHLGLPELVVADDEAYVMLAAHLGRDRDARIALRDRLAGRRAASGLFDMRAFAHDLLALATTMAQRHREDLAPAPIDAH